MLPRHEVLSRRARVEPFLETTAKLERIGVPGGAEADATHIYVANVNLPGRKYWLLAEKPDGGRKVHGARQRRRGRGGPRAGRGRPGTGVRHADTASTGGDVSKLTTRTPPDETLLQHSVAESLRAGRALSS